MSFHKKFRDIMGGKHNGATVFIHPIGLAYFSLFYVSHNTFNEVSAKHEPLGRDYVGKILLPLTGLRSWNLRDSTKYCKNYTVTYKNIILN